MSIINNPQHYQELNVPFDDVTGANIALNAFFDDVKAAREAHRIADVSVIVQVTTRGPDGTPRNSSASAYFGDPLTNKLALLAREYGAAREQHEQIMREVIEAGRRAVRERR